MADHFDFNADQRAQLAELLARGKQFPGQRCCTESASAMMRLLPWHCRRWATSAVSHIGHGMVSRTVEWCACFVSWCANSAAISTMASFPKFAGCVNGVQWFKDRGQWADNSIEPTPGMIIFFDWDSPNGSSGPQDGLSDHVGIVEEMRKQYCLYRRG